MAAQAPCPIKLNAGVRHLGWITAMRLKKTPSCAMARYTRAPERVQVAAALKQEIAIISDNHTAARGENSAAAAAWAMVSCAAISFNGRAYIYVRFIAM